MVTFILSMVLAYSIDVVLVGIAFYSIKERFQWNISPRASLLILFLTFGFLENYLWPAFFILDVTYTVRNQEIAQAFDLFPNEPLVNLFGFGFFEFITWSIQALLAGYIGEKLLGHKSNDAI